jgi:effector-binding domain-containing protein
VDHARLYLEWSDRKGGGFYVTGEFIELLPYSRIVHVERMHLPNPTPDNHIETRFEVKGNGTFMTMKMTLPDAISRAAMLSTGMEQGMEASYARFESQIAGKWERMLSVAEGAYTIVAVEPQHTAAVKFTVGFADMPNAERSARRKIADALSRLDTVTAGDSFTLCRRLTDGKMHYEPGVVVSRTFASYGDVVSSQLPGGRAVKSVLIGPFDQLPKAWPALFAWCTSQGLKLEGAFWQVYGPSAANSAKQETTLYALLACGEPPGPT